MIMDNSDNRTIWCGNLSDQVTEELLYELFLQAAPLEDIRIPIDKSGRRANYAFIVVKHEASVDYVVQLLNGTLLYNRSIIVKPRKAKQNTMDTLAFDNCNMNVNFMASALQMAPYASPPFQQNHHSDRPHVNKPYHRHDNHSNRHGWKNRHGHNNERNRRWHH